jgi:hypothetical protein
MEHQWTETVFRCDIPDFFGASSVARGCARRTTSWRSSTWPLTIFALTARLGIRRPSPQNRGRCRRRRTSAQRRMRFHPSIYHALRRRGMVLCFRLRRHSLLSCTHQSVRKKRVECIRETPQIESTQYSFNLSIFDATRNMCDAFCVCVRLRMFCVRVT